MKANISLTILLLLLPLSLWLDGCSDSALATDQFVVAYTDSPRLQVGNERLIHVTVAAVYAFEDAMNLFGGGALEVDFKHSGVLGGQLETLDQVLSGSLHATTPAIPALSNYYPNIQILSIPYLWRDPVVAWEVLDGEFGRAFFEDMAATSGLRIISIFDNGGYRCFANNVRQIRTPEDLQGLKIRTLESPAQLKIVEALGGSPTPIAWRELYTSLQTGVVDGHESSPSTIISGSLHEVQTHLTLDRHTLSLAAIVVSEEWFQELSEDLRRKVRIAARIGSVAGRGTAWTNDKLALEFLGEHGMQIYSPTEEEVSLFRAAAQPAVLDWMRQETSIDNKWLDRLLSAVEEAERTVP